MPEKKKILGFPRNVFGLGIVSFLTDVSSEMIYPLLPLFLTSVLGVNKAFIGLIEGVAESTASILKVFSGWISDKIKKRKFLVSLGYSLSTISKPFFALATAGWHVLFWRFADRVGKGIRTSPRDALIADSIEKEERGKAFGFHRAMDTAGAVVGPLLAFIFLPLFSGNYRWVFLVSFIPALLAVLVLILFVRERRGEVGKVKTSREGESQERTSKAKFALSKKFLFFVFVMALFTLGNSSDAFLILRAQSLAVPAFLIPILWLMFNVVYSLSATPGGILSDKIGRRKTILYGFFIYGLVYLGFAFAQSTWQIWALFAAYGVYYGLTEGVSRAFVADLVSSENRATAYGIYHTAVGIMAFPASVVMGLLWQMVGVSFAFSFGAGLSLVAGMLLLWLK